MAVLQVVKGLIPGQQFLVDGDCAVLGRHPDCDVVLDIAAVSRQHAKIDREADQFFLSDMGSRNGTYLNGVMIEGRESLQNGDLVVICDLSFNFFINQPSDQLVGPRPEGESSWALLVDDEPGQNSSSSIMSKVEVKTGHTGTHLVAKPETKLKAMIEISERLGKALSLEEVLPKLLDSLFKIFVQADRGFVLLQGPGEGQLIPKAVKYRRAEDEQTARISRTIVNQVMKSGQAILSADATSDARFGLAESIADFRIRSMMCAPLIDSDAVSLGVIQIDTVDQRTRFTEEDLEVLASVATQAAIAVDNAQLHEMALQQRALERDLELAHRVQQRLLPSEPPQLKGYHFFYFYDAANQVGGDYFDYVFLPQGRIAMVVADVSGKGVAAALLMAKLSGEVRYYLASQDDPAAAVRGINAFFSSKDWEDRFVTLVVAVLDPANHRLTVVNAGHMAPLLRKNSGRVEAIGEAEVGLPLGVVDDCEYETALLTLEPGDSLTFFTDGISEAMNSNGELYGLESLTRRLEIPAVEVVELGEHILDDVRQFVGERSQSDDMCLTCMARLQG